MTFRQQILFLILFRAYKSHVFHTYRYRNCIYYNEYSQWQHGIEKVDVYSKELDPVYNLKITLQSFLLITICNYKIMPFRGWLVILIEQMIPATIYVKITVAIAMSKDTIKIKTLPLLSYRTLTLLVKLDNLGRKRKYSYNTVWAKWSWTGYSQSVAFPNICPLFTLCCSLPIYVSRTSKASYSKEQEARQTRNLNTTPRNSECSGPAAKPGLTSPLPFPVQSKG